MYITGGSLCVWSMNSIKYHSLPEYITVLQEFVYCVHLYPMVT